MTPSSASVACDRGTFCNTLFSPAAIQSTHHSSLEARRCSTVDATSLSDTVAPGIKSGLLYRFVLPVAAMPRSRADVLFGDTSPAWSMWMSLMRSLDRGK